jgi:predicted transcriptional regulator of viral defense system
MYSISVSIDFAVQTEMKYIDFKKQLEDLKIFTLDDIRLLAPRFSRNRLVEWMNKEYIVRLRKNYYTFADIEINDHFLYEIANRIYYPSYISLETALSYYNLIPETVYSFTSLSTRKTGKFTNIYGTFIYKTISKDLFWGYNILEKENSKFLIASPEKALLDYLYFNKNINNENDFFELRFNFQEFKDIYSEELLNKYLLSFQNHTLEKRVNNFLDYYHNA